MNNRHLTHDELLRAMVDAADLAAEQRAHLAACPPCREAHVHLEEEFLHLGRTARKLAPAPSRRFRLPDAQTAAGWRFKAIWAMGLAAALLLAIQLGRPLWPTLAPEPVPTAAVLEEDRRLMEAVDDLVEDALPISFQHLASLDEEEAEIDPEFDEDLIDWVVPPIEENNDIS